MMADVNAAGGGSRFDAGRRLMSEVQPANVEWVWPGYIPAGALTLIEGDPGVGKSTVALDIVACVSTGRPMPGEDESVRREPRGAVLLIGEDSVDATVRARLQALGADLSRIVVREFVLDEHYGETPPNLERLEAIEHDTRTIDAAGLVLDPLILFLGPDTNPNSDLQVRHALAPENNGRWSGEGAAVMSRPAR